MNKVETKTIEKYLEELSSTSPTPGGGATAALAGAMAASLVEMVSGITIGKERYKAVEKEMKVVKKKASDLRKQLLELSQEDIEAFNKVIKAYKNKTLIEKSLKLATEVPLKTAILSNEVKKLAKTASSKGNKNALSDAKSAVYLAEAAKKSALENVFINIKSIKDKKFCSRIEKQVAELKV